MVRRPSVTVGMIYCAFPCYLLYVVLLLVKWSFSKGLGVGCVVTASETAVFNGGKAG